MKKKERLTSVGSILLKSNTFVLCTTQVFVSRVSSVHRGGVCFVFRTPGDTYVSKSSQNIVSGLFCYISFPEPKKGDACLLHVHYCLLFLGVHSFLFRTFSVCQPIDSYLCLLKRSYCFCFVGAGRQ